MGAPWAMIAQQVVTTAIKSGQAFINRDAEEEALAKQLAALESLDTITTEEANTLVSKGDIDYYNQSMDEFRKRNPELAGAFKTTGQKLAKIAASDPLAETRKLLDQRIKEFRNVDPNSAAIRSELLTQTKRNLKLGASLPPEYQAELVRAGLEEARVSGSGGNRLGPVTQMLGNKLGSAGLELEQRRRDQAATALALDDALTRSRQSILGDLVTQSAEVPTAEAALAAKLRGILGSEIPSIGLSGAQLLGVEQARVADENARKLAISNVEAQKELSKGKFLSSLLGAFAPVGGGGGGMGGMPSFGNGGGDTSGADLGSSAGNVSGAADMASAFG